MKLMLEFDLTMQPAELTLSQLTAKINAFIVEHEINSLKIHEVRRTKSRRLDEAFLTWGEGEMGEEHIAQLMSILAAQFGLVGYTNPIPDPLVLPVGLFNGAGGMASSAALPYLAGFDTLLTCKYAGPYGANTGSDAGSLRAGAGGNEYTYVQPNPLGYVHTGLTFSLMRPSAEAVMLLPKEATFTLKDASGATITLAPRAKDIVINPISPMPMFPYTGSLGFYIATNGKLYLSMANDGAVANPVDVSWDAVSLGSAW